MKDLPKSLRLAILGLVVGMPIFCLSLFVLSPIMLVVVISMGGAALGLSFLSTIVYLSTALRHSRHPEGTSGE